MIDFAERISPRDRLAPWIRHQHLQRYAWASEFARGLTVLDAACGTGYGAQLLAQGAATHVDAFDLSQQAIEQAQREYDATGIRFAVGDVVELPVESGAYDLYVSFETIEHVADDARVVAEAARVLKPGGRFVCSTPNRLLFGPGAEWSDKPHSPHHVREYAREEFRALLAPHFAEMAWYGQGFYGRRYVDALAAAARLSRKLALRLHQAQKVLTMPWQGAARQRPQPLVPGWEPEILIAVCTKSLSQTSVVAGLPTEPHRPTEGLPTVFG